jgi:hypothetical protein
MRQRLRSVVAWWGLVALACVLMPAAAQAGWLPPVNLSESSEWAGSPHVVLDSEGNATAVWDRWNGEDVVVESAFRPAGQEWGTPVDLSEPPGGATAPGEHDANSPRIAVDRNGNVTVVWERYASDKILIQSVDRPSGGSWTAPVDIAEVPLAASPEPWIAVDWEGRATAVWKHSEVVETAFRPFGGSWGEPVPLSEGESFVPQAAMDARGDTTVVWMHLDGSHYVVESAYRPEGGEWEAPTLVSQPGEEGGDPQVALDAKGDSLVVWRGEDEGAEFARAAYRPSGGSWGSPVDVSAPGEQVQSLRDAVDPDGNAIVAWAGSTGMLGGYDIVHTAFKPAEGSWESPVALSADGGNAFPSDLTFDTSGNAALTWQRSGSGDNVVQAAYRPAGEEWEAPVDLSAEGRRSMDSAVVLDAPGEASTADGNATAIWVSDEEVACPEPKESCQSGGVVQAAGYDPEGLPEVAVEAPATATVGEPVSIATPTAGMFSPVLEFGDGESAASTQADHVYDEPGEYEVKASGAEVLGYRASAQRTIMILPAGSPEPGPEEDEPEEPGTGGSEPGPGVISPGDRPASGDAASGGGSQTGTGSPGSAPAAAATGAAQPCASAQAVRAAAARLASIRAKLRRAHDPARRRQLEAVKRKQAARLSDLRAAAAGSC